MSIKNIPVRQITTTPKQQEVAGSPDFSIRDVGQLLNGRDLQQDLHRHDFFLIMALEKGNGSHESISTIMSYVIDVFSLCGPARSIGSNCMKEAAGS